MKYNKTFAILFALILLATVVSATEEENVLKTLNDFYKYSVDEDVEKYISVQDPLFLEQLETKSGISIKDYVKGAFATVDIKNYEIVDPQVFVEDNSALVYYRLKGTYEVEETKETQNIENDMVAFLWKYDDWKVRWTITRTLYDTKVLSGFLADVALEDTFEEFEEDTVKSEMIAQGYNVTIEDYEFDEAKDIESDLSSSSSYGSLLFWILIITVLIVLAYLAFKNQGKIKNALSGT